MHRLLVTGSSGFIGSYLVKYFSGLGFDVFTLGRTKGLFIPDIEADISSLSVDALISIVPDYVIHCAAIPSADNAQESDIYKVNVEGSILLARACAKAGVKRLVYLSTIKVNGEYTEDCPFTEYDIPAPIGSYANSKYQAEEALKKECMLSGLELAIIRTPLVYGCDVKGNFRRLIERIDQNKFMPVGGILNSRAMISVENLSKYIELSLKSRHALGAPLLVADKGGISTELLVKRLIEVRNSQATIIRLPIKLLNISIQIIGLGRLSKKIFGSLEVDTALTGKRLGWSPSTSTFDNLSIFTKKFKR